MMVMVGVIMDTNKLRLDFSSFYKQIACLNTIWRQQQIVNCLLEGNPDPDNNAIDIATASKYVNGKMDVSKDRLQAISDCNISELCDRVEKVLMVTITADKIISLLDSCSLEVKESEEKKFRRLYKTNNTMLVATFFRYALTGQTHSHKPRLGETLTRILKQHKLLTITACVLFFSLLVGAILVFSDEKESEPDLNERKNAANTTSDARPTINHTTTDKNTVQSDSHEAPASTSFSTAEITVDTQSAPESAHAEETESTMQLPVNTKFEWVSMDKAGSVLGARISSGFDEYATFASSDAQEGYAEYAVLLAIFQNREDEDLLIDKCTIQLNEIEERKTPQYVLYCTPPYDLSVAPEEDYCSLTLYNSGWEWTEPVTVSFKSVSREGEEIPVEEFLLSGANTTCSFEPIAPGERSTVKLFSRNMVRTSASPESLFGIYYLNFNVSSVSGYHQELTSVYFWDVHRSWEREDEISIERLTEWELGHGDDGIKKIGFVIDTARSKIENSFKTDVIIPAHSFITLPICMAPIKSCSFDATISFNLFGETKDDVIISTPKEHITVIVPNYPYERTDIEDGSSDRWKELKEEFYVFFPYQY